ncbi:MAG: FMN-binding protein [Clostridia bacterium]|nr:FMN-binding protein [Clostridia bacterium]
MKYIKCILSLTLICAVMAVLLAAVNYITAPVIADNEAKKANEALLVVMPNGEGFASVDISKYTLPQSVTEVFTEKNGGTVVKLTVAGFGPNMNIMVGVDKDGTVTGATCLSSEETLGYEKTYGATLTGATIDTVDGIDTVSGATKTTAAYKGAVKDALNTVLVLGGAEVDLRTEEDIFQDNLKAALPAADAFTTVFMLDVIEGIDAVYSANNGAGYVVCIGESFIGVDADGKVISEGVSTDEKAVATGAVATIRSWELTEIDITAYADMPTAIVAANKTNGGSYVFDVKAAGYGINGGSKYHPASGEYIYIKVSVTPDGTIVDCVTVSQAESTGVGDVCATPEYYTQYNGKTAETYSEVDTVADATITTKGYMQAIGRVFEALTILNGGAN